MALEAATTINQLVTSNPVGTDSRAQGDDHIRLIKSTLKNTFPNVTGPVTASHEQLNRVAQPGVVNFPGMIVMWSGLVTNIPPGWKLCNGVGTISNGSAVPDLRSRFVVGATGDSGGAYNVRSTGGSKDAVVVAHTHVATSSSAGNHKHSIRHSDPHGTMTGINSQGSGHNGSLTAETETAGAHTHAITINSAGESGVNKNLPPYMALAYIIKD